MASNITTSAAFTGSLMRPAPDEEIDALWGQNMADNTGYLYYRPYPSVQFNLQNLGSLPAIIAGGVSGTKSFFKLPEYGTLFGSYNVDVRGPNGATRAFFDIYVGSNKIISGTSATSQVFTSYFSTSISWATKWQSIPVTVQIRHIPAANDLLTQLDFISWLVP